METKNSKRAEHLQIERRNLIYLPFEDISYPSIPLHFINQFDSRLYAQNSHLLSLAGGFFKGLGPKSYEAYRRTVYPIASIRNDQAAAIVQGLSSAPDSSKTFADLIGERPSGKIVLREQVRYEIWEGLRRLSGNGCLLSTSHITDYFLLDVCKNFGLNLADVGLVIFDQHLDGNPQNSPSGRFVPDKSNFLIPLLRQGLGGVSIIGLHEEEIRQIISKGDLDTELSDFSRAYLAESKEDFMEDAKLMRQFYAEHGHKVSLAREIFNHTRNVLNPKKIQQSLAKEIGFLKKRGVRNILISFDLDSINLMKEMVTATPYSPFSSIVLLGIQDLSQVLKVVGLSEPELRRSVNLFNQLSAEIKTYEAMRHRKGILSPRESILYDQKLDKFGELIHLLHPLSFNLIGALKALTCPVDIKTGRGERLNELRGAHIISSDEGGFHLDQAEFMVKTVRSLTKAAGLENGIPLVNGRLMGTVSELDGRDADARSAAAAIRIINAVSA